MDVGREKPHHPHESSMVHLSGLGPFLLIKRLIAVNLNDISPNKLIDPWLVTVWAFQK
jgi:hypothetical protein